MSEESFEQHKELTHLEHISNVSTPDEELRRRFKNEIGSIRKKAEQALVKGLVKYHHRRAERLTNGGGGTLGISGWECAAETLETLTYTRAPILDKIKWNSKPPSPPKSRMKAREGQKRAIFPSLIWGEGGSRFSIYFVQDCS